MSKFYDFSPQEYKSNLISTLVCRAFRISSSYLSLHNEFNFLKELLQGNGYPLAFIEKTIGRMLKKLYKPSGHREIENYDVPKPIVYFTTYYLGDVSRAMSRDLTSIVRDSFPQIHLRILYKSHNTIGSNFSYKDKIPELCLSNLIYKYTCECCNAFYIGKTDLQFWCRITQHMGTSARTGKEISVKTASHVRDHCLKQCNTSVKLENFKVIDRLYGRVGILYLESLHQKTKKPSLGTHEQSTPLLCFD